MGREISCHFCSGRGRLEGRFSVLWTGTVWHESFFLSEYPNDWARVNDYGRRGLLSGARDGIIERI